MKFSVLTVAAMAAVAVAAPISTVESRGTTVEQINRTAWWKRATTIEQTNKTAWWKRGTTVEQTNKTAWWRLL